MIGTLEPLLWHKTVWRRGHFSPCLWWWEQIFWKTIERFVCLLAATQSHPSIEKKFSHSSTGKIRHGEWKGLLLASKGDGGQDLRSSFHRGAESLCSGWPVVIRVSVSELNISCCRCVDLGGISEAVQIFGRISCTSFCLSKNKTSFPKTSCYRLHISESRLEKMSTVFQTPR